MTALLYLPSLFEFGNYTIAIFYRWWTVHLWVEGVWEMIQGALLAYLLIRLSGIDREVMEKWLYVIVGLTFISGSARHRAPLLLRRRAAVLAADRRLLLARSSRWCSSAMSVYAYSAMRRSGRVASEHAGAALDARQRGVLGARRRPARAGAHLAVGQQVDARHADHADARARGVLRRLRDDRARDDHLRPARADRARRSPSASRRSACGRSGCRSAACSA